MRFTSSIKLWLPGATVLRQPTFWQEFLSFFGAKFDLRDEEVATVRTVLSIVEPMSSALGSVGVSNAVALVVDRQALFRDGLGVAGDVPQLLQAARQFAPAFADGFHRLDAVYEHREAGLHTVIEATFRARYRPEEPCAEITFGSRVDALRPQPLDDRAHVQDRIRESLSTPGAIQAWRAAFDALVLRVGTSVRAAFPEGSLAGGEVVPQVVKRSRDTITATAKLPRAARTVRLREHPRAHAGHGHYHDPWDDSFEDPGYVETEVDTLDVLSELSEHGRVHGHGIHVVHEHGAPICEADALASSPGIAGIDTAVFDAPPGANLDALLGAYGADDPKPTEWATGGVSGGSSDGWSPGGSSDCGKSDCSDCVSSDCTKSDCSYDCASSDCSKSDCSDCVSSDCSKSDCSSDCASSDCASSDCASSDCASSDCASSDCSSSSD